MTLRAVAIETQDRRRFAASFGLTVLLYSLFVGGGILATIFMPKQIIMANKTVIVNLIGPEAAHPGLGSITPQSEGEDKPIASTPVAPKTAKVEKKPVPAKPKPAPVKPKPVKPAVAKQIPKKTATTIPVAEVKPEPKVEPVVEPVPTPDSPAPAQPETPVQPVTQPEPVPVTPATTIPIPVEPWIPGQRPSGSRITGDSTTIAKAEKGNAMETTLGGAQGTVGQGIYVPIYLSMPLPRELPGGILAKIPAQIIPPNTVMYTAEARQRAFREFYELSGGVWKLKAPVPLEMREPLWGILEDAKYDAATADYKVGKNLMPIVLGFTVTKDLKLKNVELLQSSGDPVIDESVVYGFKRASFWNKTGDVVTGKFTYRF